MSEPTDARALARRRLERAFGDLRTARILRAVGDEPPVDAICFHAQQCAEKALKALLTYYAVDPPRTHDLLALLNQAPGGADLGLDRGELAALGPYAVEVRYSDDISFMTAAHADRALAAAEDVWARVSDVVGVPS